MNLRNQHNELIQFVLDAAEREPAARRGRIYDALAEICGDPSDADRLKELAAQLRAADANCREFMFGFSRKTSVSQ